MRLPGSSEGAESFVVRDEAVGGEEVNPSLNNFDLIRLFAATQVAILHTAGYMGSEEMSSPLFEFLGLFPGVPIFFFVSGFLITRSFERNSALREYTRNRVLRIFPALHVCVLLNILFVAGTGYFAVHGVTALQILELYAAKTTFLQFYNPDFMRGFGDGVLNGSLWTICVELQFYFLVPIIYALAVTENRQRTLAVLGAALVMSLVCNRVLYWSEAEYRATTLWKLARVSFLPWIYMFIAGMLAQRHFQSLIGWLGSKWKWAIPVLYVGLASVVGQQGGRLDNGVGPLLFFPLAAAVIVFAYSNVSLASRTLSGNDISYGIYIYHMPIVNMFLFYGGLGTFRVIEVSVLTVVFSAASWLLIERPALRRKKHPMHPAGQG